MNLHESLITLEMIQWVGSAVIWLQLRHLELTWYQFLHDASREGGTIVELGLVSALSLKIGKPTIDLVQLAAILIEASFGLSSNFLFNGPLL